MVAKKQISLDIIVVNWNAGEQIKACLQSINDSCQKSKSVLKCSVILIDNASTDNSLEYIDSGIVPLTIIKNDKNIGFAAACNQGWRKSTADYLLFLNPDTILFDRSLSDPIAFMENPRNVLIGICGIRLVDEVNQTTVSCARFPTPRILLGKMTGLNKLFPFFFPPHFMSSTELQRDREVDQVIGAYFLVRRAVFEQLNGFDERFFVYFEEVDFSLRAKQMGHSSYFLHDVTAFHKGGGSSDHIKSIRLFYSLRSRIQYAHKHYSSSGYWLTVVATLFVEFGFRLGRALLILSSRQALETFEGYKQLWAFLRKEGIASEHSR